MKLRSKLAVAAAAVVVLAAGSIGAVAMTSAQTATQTPAGDSQKQQVRDDFLKRFADNLNISVDQLTSASKQAADATVDDLVSQGKINADQAAKLKDRIDNSDGLGLGALRGARARARVREELLQRLRAVVVQSSAKAIGITPAELRTDLRNGQSIAEVAASKNVSLDSVKSQITTDVKAKLDAAVQNGRITQTQEDNALQKLAAKLDEILNKKKT